MDGALAEAGISFRARKSERSPKKLKKRKNEGDTAISCLKQRLWYEL